MHWQRLKNHIYIIWSHCIKIHISIHRRYTIHIKILKVSTKLLTVSISGMRDGELDISVSTLNLFLSELLLWYNFSIFEKKGFPPPFLIAYSIPVGFEYVWNIFYPLGHITHCLTCQVSLSWDISIGCTVDLENSAVATGLEKVSFHSNSKESQCQRMLKLPHNCTHLAR